MKKALAKARTTKSRGRPAESPRPKPKRSFKDIFAKYERYDPATEGFGNPAQWKEAFEERMGVREAKGVLRGRGPRGILGVGKDANWDEIRRAYKKLALEHHPDRAPDHQKDVATEKFKDLNAAYAILAEEFGQ